MSRRTVSSDTVPKIATVDTFEALERVGAVRGDSGIGIGNLHGHGEVREDFLDNHMVDRTFVGMLDQRFDVELDVVVRELGDGFGFLCDVVEFSHEEKGLKESPIDTGAERKCLEAWHIRLLGNNLKLLALTVLQELGNLNGIDAAQHGISDRGECRYAALPSWA